MARLSPQTLPFLRQASVLGIAAVAVLITACNNAEQPGVTASDAFVRELLPGKQDTVAYMALHNNSQRDCHLVGGASGVANKIEVHEHTHHNGRMRMQKTEALLIPPGETVRLQPGGYHLMVMGVTSGLKGGEQFTLSLEFSDCPALNLQIPVTGVLQD